MSDDETPADETRGEEILADETLANETLADEDTKRLSDELRAALAPKPKKKLLKVKERTREQSRWMARQRVRGDGPIAEPGGLNPGAVAEPDAAASVRLVEPQPDARLRGNAGPALEPEFSSGADAERFRTFAGAYGKNAARWAFLVAPLSETAQAQKASKGAPVVDSYAVQARSLLHLEGFRPALKVGDRPFSQVVVLGEEHGEGVAVYYRSEGGLSALAALLEQARVDQEAKGLSPMAPLDVGATSLAQLAAALVGGKVVLKSPSDAPFAQERWRLPAVVDDAAAFLLRMPTWGGGQRQDVFVWCSVDLVFASLTVETFERVAPPPPTREE